jgi:hypothetical protein
MDLKSIFRIVLLTLILSSCAGSRNNNKLLPPFSVSFGKTGGFTNMNPVYTIFSSGEVTSNSDIASNPVLLKNLPLIKVDSVFLLLKETGFLKHQIRQSGNISYYIEFKQDTFHRKIIWNDNVQLTPDILKLHTYLMLMIKK